MKVFLILTLALIVFPSPGRAQTVREKRDPKSDADATKKIIGELLDSCLAGKNSDAAEILSQTMTAGQKTERGNDKYDYSNPKDKAEIDGFCSEIAEIYDNGYEFGKSINIKDGFGWEVFPIAGDRGQIYFFRLEDKNYVLVDIDRRNRQKE